MGKQDAQDREEALDRLVEELLIHITGEEVEGFREFVYRYYSMDTLQDLLAENQQDLLGATLSLWKFIQKHNPDEPKVDVFNPEYSHHGWHSTHTVIRILHRDMPFVVDSARMKLNDLGSTIHLLRNSVIQHCRDADDQIIHDDRLCETPVREALLYLEVDRLETTDELDSLREQIIAVLADVARVVDDFEPMMAKVRKFTEGMDSSRALEAQEFLRWLMNNSFTFLGYEELRVKEDEEEREIIRPTENQLGLLRPMHQGELGQLELEPYIKRDFFEQTEWLSFSKAAVRSSVHRPAYPDFITVRNFDENGRVISEARIVGLYTSPVYRQPPSTIPYIRHKVEAIIQRSGLDPKSHHGKDLIQILEIYPRDELFQTSQDELFDTAMAILRIQERKQIKVFIRQDSYGPFCSALVYVPRDVYSTGIRTKIEKILCHSLGAVDSEFTTYFSESVLARVHFILKLRGHPKYNSKMIHQEIKLAASSWHEDLRENVLESFGEVHGNRIFAAYVNGFSAGYQEAFTPQSAVVDLKHFDQMSESTPLAMGFYQSLSDEPGRIHFKLYHFFEPLPLADQIPVIENLGLRVIGEHPYIIRKSNGEQIWIHDFLLSYEESFISDLQKVGAVFREAFTKIWFGDAENDRFNLLVPAAGMDWRQVAMLRSYARYLKQIRVGFSQTYIAETLCNNISITRLLVEMFEVRFNPELALSRTQRQARLQQIQQQILHGLEQVTVLSEDKIIRRYQSVIAATLRTNFYQTDNNGPPKSYISLKLSPAAIEDIPKPAPMFEIFVYSPRVEGVHLRGGKVARGGLRWSDRVEDFRTEILGLVKAQQVKNAVIVPVGAKGGFVPKHLPVNGSREEIMEEGVACYQIFIRALLDVTDNLMDGQVVHPDQVVYYDEDDSYLVVAADKGTATFSDIANEISAEYGFWLGDAFASGGSVGYDHKKMGITAKGAWVSVQRHFREKDINVQKDVITAVGIGDMAGDVFGNGMLCSETIALVGAFNHLHIFVDPHPDVAKSFAERKRLFELPRSSWKDYDLSLVSDGGGVFSRHAKSIVITDAMKQRFGITASRLTPNELIRSMLRAPVDLIWNGGIGTYIKAVSEGHGDVGDKANDPLRINGCEVQAGVIGEGGNLGLSQLGRVELALQGGALNTDFIDNSGGVDCSDHEVNIKILLNDVVASGDMTVKQRNALLESMTDEVAQLVLTNNYRQTLAISLAESEAAARLDEHRRFIEYLEAQGKLDRVIEFLPDSEMLTERVAADKGLTRPELSLLISYSKADLKEALVDSEIIEDDYLVRELNTAFPKSLVEQFPEETRRHRLRKEIIATQIANHLIDRMGITYVHRLHQTTGCTAPEVARAYSVSRDVFNMSRYWEMIESLDHRIPSELQHKMMLALIKLVRRASRWFIRLKRQDLNAQECVSYYSTRVMEFLNCFTRYLTGPEQLDLEQNMQEMTEKGVSEELALLVAGQRYLLSSLPVILAIEQTGEPMEIVARTYFAIGSRLELNWYSKKLSDLEVVNHWQSLARDSVRDELTWQQRALTTSLINKAGDSQDMEQQLDAWIMEHQGLVGRWQGMLSEIRNTPQAELAMFTVANRELMDLAQASLHASQIAE